MAALVRRSRSRRPTVHRAACPWLMTKAHGSPAVGVPDPIPAARSVPRCSKNRCFAHSPHSCCSKHRVRMSGCRVSAVSAPLWVEYLLCAALPSFPPCVCVWFLFLFEIHSRFAPRASNVFLRRNRSAAAQRSFAPAARQLSAIAALVVAGARTSGTISSASLRNISAVSTRCDAGQSAISS
jgi:hypothetical protein